MEMLPPLRTTQNEKVQPREGEKSFEPRYELRKIYDLPSSERPAALKEWKRNFQLQQKALVELYETTLATVRAHPQISSEDLTREVLEAGAGLAMTADYKEYIARTIEKWSKVRGDIATAREKYPNDKELFKALFKKAPKGEISVETGILALIVRCRSMRDYAQASRNDSRGGRFHEAISRSLGASASALYNRTVDDVNVPVILENDSVAFRWVPRSAGDTSREGIRAHEEQHQIEHLLALTYSSPMRATPRQAFRDVAGAAPEQKEREERRLLEYSSWRREDERRAEKFNATKDEKEKIAILAAAIQASVFGYVSHDMRSEVLAMTVGGDSPEAIQSRLDFYPILGADYDFLSANENVFPANFDFVSKDIRKKAQAEARKGFKKRYEALADSAVKALTRLKSENQSNEAIAGLLIAEPIEKWGKVVERLHGNGNEK